jgi:hypothetical protein
MTEVVSEVQGDRLRANKIQGIVSKLGANVIRLDLVSSVSFATSDCNGVRYWVFTRRKSYTQTPRAGQ